MEHNNAKPAPVTLTAKMTCPWAKDDNPKCKRTWIQTYKTKQGYAAAKRQDFHRLCSYCKSSLAARKSRGVSRGPRGESLIEQVLRQPRELQDQLMARIRASRSLDETVEYLSALMAATVRAVKDQGAKLAACGTECKHIDGCSLAPKRC